jgi:hypothetical protein
MAIGTLPTLKATATPQAAAASTARQSVIVRMGTF